MKQEGGKLFNLRTHKSKTNTTGKGKKQEKRNNKTHNNNSREVFISSGAKHIVPTVFAVIAVRRDATTFTRVDPKIMVLVVTVRVGVRVRYTRQFKHHDHGAMRVQ